MSKLYSFLMLPALLFCFLGISSCICIVGNYGCNFNSEFQREVDLETDMGEGMTFSAQTTHSHIHVSGTDDKRCYVKANIRVRAESIEKAKEIAEKVKVDFEKSGNQVVMIVDKPELPKNCGVYVSYNVKLPRKTNVILKTTHDPIICTNIVGDLKLSTTHDPIKLSHITGRVEANTTHDPIEAEYVTGPMLLETTHGRVVCRDIDSDLLRIRTSHDNVNVSFKRVVKSEIDADVNTSHGNITFNLPADFKGSVHMSTTHGKVKSDVPIIVKGEISEEKVSGIIGKGVGRVNLKTKHGSIVLK